MIPIQNIYYLLCYAWNGLEESELVDVHAGDNTELVDLFARILIQATNHILKRGLDRAYLGIDEDLRGIRGRLNIDPSIKRLLFQSGRANCTFDELTHDSLINRILRTTIGNLMRVDKIEKENRKHLRQLHARLSDVSEIRLENNVFRRVQLHRNNSIYRFALNVCELLHYALLPEQREGHFRFRDFLRDEEKMRKVFQDFVYNFYRIELRGTHKVKADRITWVAEPLDLSASALLPEMQTDVVLRSLKQTTVIDTKYSKQLLQSYWEKKSFRSEHLYQIYAYLKNLEVRGVPDSEARGILLYPANGIAMRSDFLVPGHLVTIFALDLGKSWQSIKADLLSLVSYIPELVGASTSPAILDTA